jgi:hypothetical protein
LHRLIGLNNRRILRKASLFRFCEIPWKGVTLPPKNLTLNAEVILGRTAVGRMIMYLDWGGERE